MAETIEHAESNAATPFEEAADPFYEDFFGEMIKGYAEECMFPEQWAHLIGVSEPRMFSWLHKYPEFAECFASAVTILRSKFTSELMDAARGKKFGAQSSLYMMVAKKRFADLYGDIGDFVPPGSGTLDPAKARDITPKGDIVDEQRDYESMQEAQLLQELEKLKKRHQN